MAVKPLLLQIETCSRHSIARSGEIDLDEVATIVELALEAPDRGEVIRGLADFIGSALCGNVIDPRSL